MPPREWAEQPPSYGERWAALRNLPAFMRLVWQANPGLTVLMVALRLARAVMPVTMLWVGKLIIDEVIRLIALDTTPGELAAWWQSGLLGYLSLLVAAELGLALVSDLLGRGVNYTNSLMQERLVISLSIRVMDHAATLDLEDFEDAAFQDKLDRARRITVGNIPLLNQVMGLLQDLVTVASFAAGLLIFNPWLVVLLLIALVPAFLGEIHFNALTYAMNYRRTAERREMDYLRMVGASADSAKEVKIFALNDFLRDRFADLSQRFFAENRGILRRQLLWMALLTAFGTLSYYGAYLWIIGATLTAVLSIGDLTFLSGSFLRLRGLLEGVLTGFSGMASQALRLDDLFDFFNEQPEIASPATALPVPEPIRQGFVFEDVGFRYPNAERWAVRHLSFTLHAGETLALVGENGAGKTTLVKLLARLYDPDEGRILMDGRDLRDYDLDQLRAAMGVIFQDFVRYSMSASDNVAVGRIGARGDQARIEDAAHQSGADQVIAKLPAGYEQMVGKRFAHGVDLSGGEWQKLAIARAYMRDAQVLILDEPTAALDARAEFEVFQRFKELSEGKTAVLISHRFSSVRMADRILVLADGRVEAQGTHAELLAQPGRYRDLFELQAAGYR
ncbi:ABC transporter ATP-binding protein [Paracoccus tegillarcae]|uniref:ABC transporter ATP-binding protein n=1 Tax=Paracoccus tegillarcae TaxID=1529068 RepID=A0A2K9EK65_9RHOB|nr:ABC transporter ATP-binding protein [Paracoccus tegillarcae]AUH34789.1 ABC transporter ATP-binding protein [Paracoccus tegillarcae]